MELMSVFKPFRLLFILLLLAIVPFFVWVVATQRVDIRNRAADTSELRITGTIIQPSSPESSGSGYKLKPPSAVSCDGPEGSVCKLSTCPTCTGPRCPMVACREAEGICRNNVCTLSPPTIPSITPYPTTQVTSIPTSTPTPRPVVTSIPTPWFTVTPTPTPATMAQTMELRVRLAGVSASEANGAKVSVKFALKGGTVQQLSAPLTLSHVAGGVYKATAMIANPFPAGTQLRIKVKGEKHVSVQFCKQVGQTGPCLDTDYITVPNPVPLTYGFDLTGIPLPPGDLPPQDGRADMQDLERMKPLMAKPCSSLTAAEKLVGDVDYNGCVNVRDVFLILQTLRTRYDE